MTEQLMVQLVEHDMTLALSLLRWGVEAVEREVKKEAKRSAELYAALDEIANHEQGYGETGEQALAFVQSIAREAL